MADVGDAVQRGLQVVANLSEEVHWLCNRVEPDANGRIAVAEEDLETRADSTIHAMLLLSFSDQEESQAWLRRRIGDQLARCSQCVEEFYACKSRFYQQLLPDHGRENVDQFFEYLTEWDIERITPVLLRVASDLEDAPSADQWYENVRREKSHYNAIYECLCSRDILLRSRHVRTLLQRICRTGKVEIDGNPTGLVFLLFRDEPEFRALAERAWEAKGKLMTSAVFETNLLEVLETVTHEAEEFDVTLLSRFFSGLSTIVKHVTKEVIMKCIAGARHDAIKFAVQRMQPNCPYWPSLLRLFDWLMIKLGNEFWDTVSPLSSSAFPDIIFNDQRYQKLLRLTEQGAQGEKQLLDLTEWTSSYITTILPLNKPTSAQPLTRQLLRSDLPALSRGICLKEGMKVLNSTLSDVQQELGQVEGEANIMIVRHVNQLINDHLGLVAEIAFSTATFGDQLMGNHMMVAQEAARDAIASVLRLDLGLFEFDFGLLSKKRPEKPIYSMTIRHNLWDSVCRGLRSDDPGFCGRIIEELKPIFGFERLRDSNSDGLGAQKKQLNTTLAYIDRKVAAILQKLLQFPQPVLEEIFGETVVREVILGCTLLPSADLSMTAEDILLKVFNADDMRDTLRNMCLQDMSLALSPVAQIGRLLSSNKGLFPMMHRWIKFNMELVEVLCDRFDGIIRKDGSDSWQKTLLRTFWEVQWRTLANIFKKSRRWAMYVDKTEMMEFCRDSMDYAETLFDNFWAFEQALRGNEDRGGEWKIRLLQDASKALAPLAGILTIQDAHLLRTCQELVCKILKLLAQEEISVADPPFFMVMKKMLYPQTLPDFDPKAPPATNLTEVQRGELSAAISSLRPDFVPVKEITTIELSDDDDYGDIPDDDFLTAEQMASRRVARSVQTKLDFPAASMSRLGTPKPTIMQSRPSALRHVGRPKPQDDEKRRAFLEKRKAEKAALEAHKAAVVGTKPKPVKHSLSDSSSEESSSEGDAGNSLFKLGGGKSKITVTDGKVIPEASRRIPAFRPALVTRRAKDNRARIAPDLSPLYKQIFTWDFFHDDEFPPGLSQANYASVPKSFKTYAAYHKTFEPLLLLEAWQSFLSCKQDVSPSDALEVKIATRMRADNFVELDTNVLNMPERGRWIESDIVLLSASKTPLKDRDAVHCIARVHSVNRKWPKAPTVEVSLRCEPVPKMLQDHMRNGGTLYGIKLMSLIPLEREYTALVCLQYYGLMDEILNGKPGPALDATDQQVRRTRDLYDVNEPQARAILSAISNEGFTLIQGPPGTGKTKTVVGIVGATLTPNGDVINVPGQVKAPSKISKKKILVCAPSNAAVDELVIRFKQGLRTQRGEHISPYVVRVGYSDAINAEVKDVTLDYLVEAKISLQGEASKGSAADLDALRQKYSALVEERNKNQQELDAARAEKKEPPAGLLGEVDKLNASLREMRRQLDDQRDKRKETSRTAELARRRAQQEVMDEAQIICATLSGTGHDMLRNVNVDFETVVIDEAAQSVELSALIPLKFGCERCILVGDPQQLPPTVLSRAAARFSYEKSLFVRIQENHPKAVNLLSIQYRMHPMISAFPSREFYNSELRDGEGMAEKRKQPWHNSRIFGSYKFFNVSGKESLGGRQSLVNFQEINTAVSLYERLTLDFGSVEFAGRIGIVTPYRQQLVELRKRFQGRFGEGILSAIEFNTVDAFQGRERDIIIFSCVRASEEGGIGFLADVRRLNVAITRAKCSLFVLGNSKYLVRNPLWRRLIEDAKNRNVFLESDPSSFSARIGGNWDPMDIDEGNRTPRSQMLPTGNPAPQRNPPAGPRYLPAGPRGAPPSTSSVRCHACKGVGHLKKDCPNIQSAVGGKPQASSNSNKRADNHILANNGPGNELKHNQGPRPAAPPRASAVPDYMKDHDPRIPVVRDAVPIPTARASLKRTLEEAESSYSGPKQENPGGGGGSSARGPNPGLQGGGPPKKIQRRGNSNPFLPRKGVKRHPPK